MKIAVAEVPESAGDNAGDADRQRGGGGEDQIGPAHAQHGDHGGRHERCPGTSVGSGAASTTVTVRGDTETAIARKQRDLERKDREIERLDGQIAEKDARIRELEKVNREQHEEIMSLRYPGVHVQVEAPLEHEEP